MPQNPTRQVHLGMKGIHVTKQKQTWEKVYCKMADKKPNKSNGEKRLPRCTVVANHNDVTNGGELLDPDEEAIKKK